MTYPFGAVVGMDDMRLALLLNAVSPAVGGVLVRGEKGTAKSTTVRALSAVLPPVDVVAGCRFACDPAAPDPACPDGPHDAGAPGPTRPARLVELPVGASEDRVVGSLDLERALTEGVKAFEPGLLAAAHRGVLYVDEVNLLHDHLVDLLLDAAALGTAYVEREGVSVRHAARFLLVGTMNPEEGELRPQLLDRFGLTVEVAAPRDPAERAEVVRRRFAYDADPAGFAASWADEEAGLARRIAEARARLPRVVLSDGALRQVTAVCAAFDVDGLRADLVTARAAIAHAAWCGRDEVTEDDVRVAARLALPHRRRRNPFDAPGLDDETLEQALSDARPDEDPPQGPDDGGGTPPPPPPPGSSGDGGAQPETDGGTAASPPSTAPRGEGGGSTEAAPAPDRAAVAPADPFRTRRLEVPGIGAGVAGRRSRARGDRGRVVGATRPSGTVTRLHLTGTVLAAAPHQVARGRTGPGLRIAREDLRQAVLEGREGNLVLFVVDASGSMGSRSRMAAVKGAVLSLLLDAYQRRDKVGLVTFRGTEAELALPPTWSVEAAAARLTGLPTGGRTPLAAGLLRAHETLRVERVRDPQRRPLLVVVTDGRATGARGGDHLGQARRAAGLLAADRTAAVVVDCESGPVRLGLAGALGTALGAQTLRLDELAAESLAATVRSVREAA
ncbi:protoporphyrin IX magnesium-chelatase [Geodermatophilus obscurus]|uniref:Mg-protoporphyrin IX chelatase n=1 Tax=Geodermatophilus obscurus TaxID=1861 RepID=A0A1M7V0S7_9ACTN|nr:putative cobaltochelatase [Geodermatophilus obscurus]SHN88814.1 protoporphyrin IX magnesium-chelatase [Geodermatophilus obscurus]